MLYAIGEILLVVIGILIALQIDSWYSQKIEKIRIDAYYDELSAEFEGIGNSIRLSQKKNDSIISELDTLLVLLRRKPEGYQDRLTTQLPTLYEVPDIHIVTLIVAEFANSGLFSKLSDSSRQIIISLILDIEEINRQDVWAKEQHIANIEPFLLKHLEYQAATSYGDVTSGESFKSSISIPDLVKNPEFKNIVILKRNIHIRNEASLSAYLNNLHSYREFLKTH